MSIRPSGRPAKLHSYSLKAETRLQSGGCLRLWGKATDMLNIIFPAIWLQAVPYYLRQLPLGLVILVLALLAFRGWAQHLRRELPAWRNALGLTSILATLINLLALAAPVLLAMVRTNLHLLTSDWMAAVILLVFLSICFAFALRGAPRVEMVLAGLLSALLLIINIRI